MPSSCRHFHCYVPAAESYLRRDEDGSDMPGSTARMQLTLAELKLDNANSMSSHRIEYVLLITTNKYVEQQVLDMLRDHLTDALSELASSRTHAHELQESYAIERRTSQQAMADVTAASSLLCLAVCFRLHISLT